MPITTFSNPINTASSNRRDGNGNPFAGAYGDQCTFWAQQRYHDMTGIWSPCTGNGYQWASQAAANGWIVTSQPPKNQPSIICMQPGIQLSDINFGHVGVVERVNSDGSVYCSNYNVYPHIGDKITVYTTFRTGNGVSFIYAGNNVGSLNLFNQIAGSAGSILNNAAKTYTLSSNSTVSDALISLDSIMTLRSPFDNVNAEKDNIGPVSFTDPVSWFQGVGTNIIMDGVAIILRGFFLLLGLFLFFKVIDHFVNFGQVAQNVGSTVEKVVPLLLA